MLVISRKENESLVIDLGDEIIEITVTELGKQVRLGIDAPAGRKIWRKEIYTTLQENKQAAKDLGGHNVRDVLRTLQAKAQPESE